MQTRFRSASESYRFARPTDLNAIVGMLGDDEVGAWLWFVPAPPEALRGYFLPLIEQQWQTLADAEPPTTAIFVVEDAEAQYLGQGAVMAVEGSVGGFEIGFQLPKLAWRTGVGTRLAEFLVTWATRLHAPYRLQAGCIEGNAGSRRILEKLGMRLEGTRPDFRLKGDARHTELEFGMRVANLDPLLLRRTEARVPFDSEL
ncbi:MAG: GNAT family N-acetyltransferase [Nannocystaceae bacterium]|nr:GNAT family N-acetyltransferase [Nannocystaceae bacterium]